MSRARETKRTIALPLLAAGLLMLMTAAGARAQDPLSGGEGPVFDPTQGELGSEEPQPEWIVDDVYNWLVGKFDGVSNGDMLDMAQLARDKWQEVNRWDLNKMRDLAKVKFDGITNGDLLGLIDGVEDLQDILGSFDLDALEDLLEEGSIKGFVKTAMDELADTVPDELQGGTLSNSLEQAVEELLIQARVGDAPLDVFPNTMVFGSDAIDVECYSSNFDMGEPVVVNGKNLGPRGSVEAAVNCELDVLWLPEAALEFMPSDFLSVGAKGVVVTNMLSMRRLCDCLAADAELAGDAEDEERFDAILDEIATRHSRTREVVQNQHDATQLLVTGEHGATRTVVSDKHSQTRDVVRNQHDATQTLVSDKHARTRDVVQNQHDATQTILTGEHDATRTLVADENAQTRELIDNNHFRTIEFIEEDGSRTRDQVLDSHSNTRDLVGDEHSSTRDLVGDEHSSTRDLVEDEHSSTRDLVEAEADQTRGELSVHDETVRAELDEHDVAMEEQHDEILARLNVAGRASIEALLTSDSAPPIFAVPGGPDADPASLGEPGVCGDLPAAGESLRHDEGLFEVVRCVVAESLALFDGLGYDTRVAQNHFDDGERARRELPADYRQAVNDYAQAMKMLMTPGNRPR